MHHWDERAAANERGANRETERHADEQEKAVGVAKASNSDAEAPTNVNATTESDRTLREGGRKGQSEHEGGLKADREVETRANGVNECTIDARDDLTGGIESKANDRIERVEKDADVWIDDKGRTEERPSVTDDKLQLHRTVLVDKCSTRQQAIGGCGDKGPITMVPVAHFANGAQVDMVLYKNVGDVIHMKHVAVAQRQCAPHAIVALVLRERIDDAHGVQVDCNRCDSLCYCW